MSSQFDEEECILRDAILFYSRFGGREEGEVGGTIHFFRLKLFKMHQKHTSMFHTLSINILLCKHANRLNFFFYPSRDKVEQEKKKSCFVK